MAKPPPLPEPEPLQLTTSDLIGIIQRALKDLHHYCDQMPRDIDPHVVMTVLTRIAEFVGKLTPHVASNDRGQEAAARAAN